MFWPGSQQFWRPLPWCCAPFPSGERLGRPEVCARSSQLWRAFSLRGEQPGQPGACAHSPPGAVHLFPPQRAAQAARGLAPSPRACRAFSLRGPSGRRSGLRKSLDRNQGLFAMWEGVVSLGLSLPLFPSPCLLPPAGMGRLFSGVSQSLCFANRRRCVLAG